jgi:transposase
MNRHELTDEQWSRLASLLPPERPATGRPNHDHRRMLNAILWRYATGAPWRDLPVQYGPWESVYSRFRRWQLAGVWDRLLAGLQAEAAADGRLDWTLHFVDGSVVRAHQHAAGAKKGDAAPPRQRPTRRSAGAGAASAPSSMLAPKAAASR